MGPPTLPVKTDIWLELQQLLLESAVFLFGGSFWRFNGQLACRRALLGAAVDVESVEELDPDGLAYRYCTHEQSACRCDCRDDAVRVMREHLAEGNFDACGSSRAAASARVSTYASRPAARLVYVPMLLAFSACSFFTLAVAEPKQMKMGRHSKLSKIARGQLKAHRLHTVFTHLIPLPIFSL